MIKIKDAATPEYLFGNAVEASKIRIREQANNGDQTLDITNHWSDVNINNTIKDVLFEMHHDGKCCYCERKRTRKREMDVEHYRPKAGVTEDRSHKGYWWLAYDWNNYLWSCKNCNQGYKSNHFPLLPSGVRAGIEGDDLALEEPCLINPRFEEPSTYLGFYTKRYVSRYLVKVVANPGLSDDEETRAEETIRILGLNRAGTGDDLVSERGEVLTAEFEQIVIAIKSSEHAINAVVPEHVGFYTKKLSQLRVQLKPFVQAKKTFCGVFRDFLKNHEIDYSDLI